MLFLTLYPSREPKDLLAFNNAIIKKLSKNITKNHSFFKIVF